MRPLILFEKTHLKHPKFCSIGGWSSSMRSSNTIRKLDPGWSRSNASKYPTFKLTKEGFLCGFALQNKMQNKYLPRATKCRILDFIRFMVSRDFGKLIWMCSRALLHMCWSALTRELQIEKGKQDWQDESDPQVWHEAPQFPKLRWQQKQSSLTMFTGLSYSQLMPTPWPATEQYKNTRDPYKSTQILQFTISFYFLFFILLLLILGPGPHSFAAFRQSRPHSHASAIAQGAVKGWWVEKVERSPHGRCVAFLSPDFAAIPGEKICDHGITDEQSGMKSANYSL